MALAWSPAVLAFVSSLALPAPVPPQRTPTPRRPTLPQAGNAAPSGNMNGKYVVASGGRVPAAFNDDYASKGHEYFDVWAPEITSHYGEVYASAHCGGSSLRKLSLADDACTPPFRRTSGPTRATTRSRRTL
eukprot:1001043-Prymnesium_polylepis.1